MGGDRIDVVFTAAQVDAPARTPGLRWVAELVDATGHRTVPLCVAWLTDYRPVMPMCLDFLIVPFEDDRRLGYGTRMVDECRARWPGLISTDPCTREGEGFHATLFDVDFGTALNTRGLTMASTTAQLFAKSELKAMASVVRETAIAGVDLLIDRAAGSKLFAAGPNDDFGDPTHSLPNDLRQIRARIIAEIEGLYAAIDDYDPTATVDGDPLLP
jgi:hypothetical protein